MDRALAAAQESPSSICLTPRYRTQIDNGTLPSAQRDRLVVRSIELQKGGDGSFGGWHYRAAFITWTYTAFWSRTEREEIFSRAASRMIDCPWKDRLIREGHSNL